MFGHLIYKVLEASQSDETIGKEVCRVPPDPPIARFITSRIDTKSVPAEATFFLSFIVLQCLVFDRLLYSKTDD